MKVFPGSAGHQEHLSTATCPRIEDEAVSSKCDSGQKSQRPLGYGIRTKAISLSTGYASWYTRWNYGLRPRDSADRGWWAGPAQPNKISVDGKEHGKDGGSCLIRSARRRRGTKIQAQSLSSRAAQRNAAGPSCASDPVRPLRGWTRTSWQSIHRRRVHTHTHTLLSRTARDAGEDVRTLVRSRA